MALNPVLVRSTVVAALGGLLFGFDTAVISGATHALSQTYSLSPALLGTTVSSALWGTVVGSLLAGFPADRLGRRDSLRIMAILYLVIAGATESGTHPALEGKPKESTNATD